MGEIVGRKIVREGKEREGEEEGGKRMGKRRRREEVKL